MRDSSQLCLHLAPFIQRAFKKLVAFAFCWHEPACRAVFRGVCAVLINKLTACFQVCVLLILRGLQTEGLAALQEQSTSSTGPDHEGWNHLTAPIQTPSSQPNLPPLLLNPPSPPPPVPAAPLLHSQLSHSHTLFSLSCCVPVPLSLSLSLSFPPLPQSGQSSSLLSCPLYIPPPLFVSLLQLWEQGRLSSPQVLKGILWPKLLLKTLFSFLTSPFFISVLNPSPPERPVGVRLACAQQRVRGLWCRALCPWRESPKVVTEVKERRFHHHECSAAAPVGPGWPFLRPHPCK